mmetsp:Transcript_7310/g.15979  ORF Transcript_7310/g.15979 Transcript_7310/m.15979 type:complete len:80 (-) Transcript_7310:574-813(-)
MLAGKRADGSQRYSTMHALHAVHLAAATSDMRDAEQHVRLADQREQGELAGNDGVSARHLDHAAECSAEEQPVMLTPSM